MLHFFLLLSLLVLAWLEVRIIRIDLIGLTHCGFSDLSSFALLYY